MADDAKKSDEDTAAESVVVAEAMDDFDTDAVIEAFGGIRPMAAKLEIAVSTVQGWKTRSHIPENRWRDIINAASVHNVDLSSALPEVKPVKEDKAADTVIDDEDRPDPEPYQDTDAKSDPSPEATTPEDVAPPADNFYKDDTPEDRMTGSDGPPASSGSRLALMVAVAALAAVVLRPVWGPYVDPHFAKLTPAVQQQEIATGPAPDLEEVNATLTALNNRLAVLESRPVINSGEEPAAGSGELPIPADLLDRIAGLEAELTALSDVAESLQSVRDEANAAITQTRNALAASIERDEAGRARLVERLGVMESLLEQATQEAERATAELAGLEALIARNSANIQTLERRPALEGAAQAGLALAVGDVETALSFGRPFEGALARLSGLAGDNSDIAAATAALAPHAVDGVATRAELIANFQRDLPAIQAELGRGDGDILDVLMDGARSLISIRRKGESPDAPAVSRAEAALSRGDLSSAVAALSPEREASATAAAWLDQAEARLAAESVLMDLRNAVAAGLTGIAPESEALPPPETAPAETAPAETTPAETTPAEASPTETSPTETAPAESGERS